MNIFHTKIRCNRINAKCCKIMDFIAQNNINLASCDIINKTLHHSPTTNERSINDLQNDTRHSNIQYTATSNLFFCSLPLSLSFTVRLLPLFIIVCGVASKPNDVPERIMLPIAHFDWQLICIFNIISLFYQSFVVTLLLFLQWYRWAQLSVRLCGTGHSQCGCQYTIKLFIDAGA